MFNLDIVFKLLNVKFMAQIKESYELLLFISIENTIQNMKLRGKTLQCCHTRDWLSKIF